MKTIEVDEELYRYIASHTLHIGESASDILRRMLKFTAGQSAPAAAAPARISAVATQPAAAVVEARPQDRVRAVRELLLSDEYAEQKKAVNRFMLILSTLSRLPNRPWISTSGQLSLADCSDCRRTFKFMAKFLQVDGRLRVSWIPHFLSRAAQTAQGVFCGKV